MPVFFAEEGEEINFVFEPHPARDLANALVVPFQFVCAIEILTWTINWWTGMEGKARKSLLSLLPLSKNRAAISEIRGGEPMFSATYRMTSGRFPNPHLRDFLKKSLKNPQKLSPKGRIP